MNDSSLIPAPDTPKTPTVATLRDRDEHLESLKRLASRMAHDFNNFLAPILGYSTLIKEEVAPDSGAAKYAGALENAARKSESKLDRILFAARPKRRFRIEKVDLAAVIRTELETLSADLSDTSQIKVIQNLEPCSIQADPSHCRTIIRELLNNARYSLATGGAIEVTLVGEQLTSARANELGISGEHTVRLTVRDDGFGMSPEVLKQAFEPFFSTRSKAQDAGLGLTIVFGVVRLHGGQILLESAEDRGTTATIWIPFLDYGTHRKTAEAAPAAIRPGRAATGKKILLVEDDPTVAEVVRACLQKAGYGVYTGQDGLEGLKLYRQYAKELVLIVSDVSMPKLNGVDMVIEIRKTSPDLPAIMISGDTDAQLQESMAAFGGNVPTLMKKPFSLGGLVAAVRKELGIVN